MAPGWAGPTGELDGPTLAPTPRPGTRLESIDDDALTRYEGDTADTSPTGPLTPPAPSTASGDTGPLEPGQAFGARYHIIRLLGIGGMGAVYQAWDAELGVSVAIKVIRPEIMADPRAGAEVERRFKRELLLARQVTHKNVVRIHDLGEIDGIKYITMSYVDGSDLATVLKRDGKLPIATVLHIGRSVASGLVAAHAAGVVHRDLKPANIMIGTDGEALIMDFGIARSSAAPVATMSAASDLPAHLRRAAARTAAGVTTVQGVVGTVEYMAPEQARGLAVDQRADIYAFALILYDMLLGRQRGKRAESVLAELQDRMQQAPPSVRSIATDTPEPFDQVISRCLDPDPAKRYQTTIELAADLDRLDDKGERIPEPRRITPRLVVVTAAIILLLLGGTFFVTRQSTLPPKQHEPVSVIIADLQNLTGDPAFDRVLEPMLKRALEGAGFISAYDRNTIIRTLGVTPPDTLDEAAAREVAVKQGLGIVFSGSIDRQGSGFRVSVKAAHTVTGDAITSASGRASNKDEVLSVATRLVTTVRKALGDDESESTQMFAMASLSATSLDVVRLYAAAQDAASNNKFEEVRQNALKAVELDPKFGVGYQLLAVQSRNVGRLQDAERYITEALRYVEGMTERERLSTRGFYYRVTGEYQQCVKEYGDLIARYAADVVGHNQLALCSSKLRDMRRAVTEMQSVVDLLPKRVTFRDNLALYASYAGDFQKGEQEARTVEEPDAYARMALAFAQLGQGQIPQAIETYKGLATIGELGASFSASGLGDAASLEGRFSDAVRILEQGAAVDLMSMNADKAAAKFVAVAHARIARRQNGPAIAAAEKALTHSKAVSIRFLAARVFIEAGATDRARTLIAGLASEVQAEPQAHAKILDGEIALKEGNPRDAIKVLTEANTLLDTWIGHFDLGRAYLEARQFPQADSEFDRCLKRRGEALSLFIEEEPTYALFPVVYYYQGRVREGLNSAGATESYRAYLAIRGQSTEDPLLPEVRRLAGR